MVNSTQGQARRPVLRFQEVAFAVGGWLLSSYLGKIGAEAVRNMEERVLCELRTTFVSHYTREIALAEALQLETIREFTRRATGEKYLINPQKSLQAAPHA